MFRRDLLVTGLGLLGWAFPVFAETPAPVFEGPESTTLALSRAADGKLYFRSTVMGRELLLFVDTGALTILDLAVAHSLRLPLTDTGQSGFGLTGLAGKRISGEVDLWLGQIRITGLPVDFMDLGQMKAVSRSNGMPEFDGLIGAELLTMLRARIDFERLTLTLKRPR